MLTLNKNNSGLTLIELLIATVILVVAISGILSTFAGLLSINENARKLSLAMTAVHGKMEEIRDSDFGTLFATYNETNFDPSGFAPADAKGNVHIDNTDLNLLEVCVSVSWRGRSNKITGEDINLDGAFNTGEDLNSDGRLSSPAESITLMGQR